jgi:hypothetical protein
MTDEYRYKRLVLDPRCLKPFYETNDINIYTEATKAIKEALDYPHASESEKRILRKIKTQVNENKLEE